MLGRTAIGFKGFPDPLGPQMEKRESDIGFCAAPLCNNSPVRTEAKYKIAIAMDNRPNKLALLNQIANNEEKKGFMRRNSAGRVIVKIAQDFEPSSPIRRC